MFKKFIEKENVVSVNNMKSSVQKGIRSAVLESYPNLESCIDVILPKKGGAKIVKCHEHVEIVASPEGELIFFRQREEPYVPTMRLLHRYPYILPKMQVDKGAIKHILNGSNIMCPGLTSAGGRMSDVAAGTVVGIFAEGKSNALAIGRTTKSTQEILQVNKDVGIELLHYLRDGLWLMKAVK